MKLTNKFNHLNKKEKLTVASYYMLVAEALFSEIKQNKNKGKKNDK